MPLRISKLRPHFPPLDWMRRDRRPPSDTGPLESAEAAADDARCQESGEAQAARYKAELLTQVEREFGLDERPLQLIRQAIRQLADPGEREHAPHHEVRYLLTYALTPSGPGHLIDIGASAVYDAPLRDLKNWTIERVPTLALDFEEERLPFANSAMDGALLCEVIEHFTVDPLHCLIEVNRVLKLGAFLVLTTPNMASWYAIHRALHQEHPSRWPVYALSPAIRRHHIHAREYVASEISPLLAAAGFEVVALTTRDYGIAPPFRVIPGYATHDRGETIFCLARKIGAPLKRAVRPIYLADVDMPTSGQ
jgi:SAM-dependent methyltransferase